MKKFKDLIKKLNENNKGSLRELAVESKTIDEEARSAEFSVSSDKPYERWFGSEILDHKSKSIRLERFKDGAALKDTHNGDQVGIIEKAWVDTKERKLRIIVRFSKNTARAVEIFKDIVDGIRRNVSIRYLVHEMELEKDGDEGATYRVTDWEPIHASIESDPADASVGLGRSTDPNETVIPIDGNKNLEEQINKFNKSSNGIKIIFNKRENKAMTEEEKKALKEKQEKEIADQLKNTRESEVNRAKALREIAKDYQANVPGFDLVAEAEKAIASGQSEESFRKLVMDKLKDPEALRTSESHLDLPKKDLENYSLRKIILYQLGKIGAKEVGLELEASKALAKKLGKSVDGIGLPADIMNRRRAINLSKLSLNEKGLVVGTAGSGGYTVHDQYIAESFIDIIINNMAFKEVGVNILTGLVGDIPMVRELDNYTHYWTGEGSGITESDITFGEEKMMAKKGGALGRYSYEFLNQSSIAVEAYIERRLAIACALGLDRAIGYGSGTAAQPKGIKNWTGVGGTSGTAFSFATALEMEGAILDSVGNTFGTPKWLSKGSLRSTLKGRLKTTGINGYLVENNEMIGYDFSKVSNQFDANDLFFGHFSTVLLGIWDMLSIKASEFDDDAFKAGDVLVRALHHADVFVEQPGALDVIDNFT